MKTTEKHNHHAFASRALASVALVLCTFVLLCSTSGCNQRRSSHSLMEDGNFHFRQGEHEQAATLYQQIADRYPGNWEAQYRLGLARLKLGEADAARIALQQAHTLQPRNDDVAEALADAMFQQGNNNELYAFLRDRANTQRTTRSYLALAENSMRMNDPDTASVATMTAIDVDGGKSVEPYLLRAEFARSIQDQNEALRRLRQAYGINPRDSRVLEQLREMGVTDPTMLPPGK
ncbi:MAG: tetratricopeptide repeat protein [Phycisphaerales bacterium]